MKISLLVKIHHPVLENIAFRENRPSDGLEAFKQWIKYVCRPPWPLTGVGPTFPGGGGGDTQVR